MSAKLDALHLTCKQAEARRETAYTLIQLLPAHNPKAPEWLPVWNQLRELTKALEVANTAFLAACRQEREANQLAAAGTYTVQFIAEAPTETTAKAA